MSEPFLGEIKMFAGNYAPRGYAFCNGQVLPINQNQALFSLLGTTYGGNGQTTFALPDLRGRMPMHAGTGPGLTNRVLGAGIGTVTETLSAGHLPAHTHTLNAANNAAGTTGSPGPTVGLATTATAKIYGATTYNGVSTLTTMAQPLGGTGGSQPHMNQQPYLGINFIIALQGIFPSRN